MIRAGTIDEIDHKSGLWVYFDIGFSKNATSGLIIGDEEPIETSYADATNRIIQLAARGHRKTNLVIEAPLSIAFDSYGNPAGRACELHNGRARYWYVGAGAVVTLAAMYLLDKLNIAFQEEELILYEGFVSFKDRKSTHIGDAQLLKETVDNRHQFESRIIPPEDLKKHSGDIVESAFRIQGIDSGIPPVIAVFG